MAFPTTSVLDDFTRSDGALGGNWAGPSLGFTFDHQVISNACGLTSANFSSDCWASSFAGPDLEAFVDNSVNGTQNRDLVMLDSPTSATPDGYRVLCQFIGGDDWQIGRLDDAVFTQLGASITQDVASGDSIGMERSGSSISAYHKTGGTWTALGSRTDSTYTTSNYYIGLVSRDTTNRFDNFGGGTIGGAPAATFTPTVVRSGLVW